MPDATADAELVARSRQRDHQAFGQLVERHQRLVFGVALARCHDPALAEDVAQEAFVAAWRDLDRLRDGERVGSWVAGIARNLASSAARTSARRAVELPASSAAAPTPEDEALEREDRELLQRALADVPEAHREALVLFYLEGESIAHIAAALGVREDLIKQRLSRGRKALRESVAARVESALERARRRPALRAGVIAAVSALGARHAAAAGRVATVVSAKKLAIAGVGAALLTGGAIWYGARGGAEPAAAPAAPAAVGGPPSPPRDEGAPHSVRVKKLESAAKRAALLQAIREAARARTAKAASPAHASRSARPPGPRGEIPKDDTATTYILAAVRELTPQLKECFMEGLDRDPNLGGRVGVTFMIEGEPDVGGVITESEIDADQTTITDLTVRECIQQTMYGLEIDPPAGGGKIEVRNAFEFSTREDDDKH